MTVPPSLFDQGAEPGAGDLEGAPLADRMRPRSLDEVIGQEKTVGEDGFLRRAIAEDRVPSLIFWGPPGAGKTTLARIVAKQTSSRFVPFSAVTSGIKQVKGVMAEAAVLRRSHGRRTLLFVDEIHRFNRAQQDAFLPYVENGDILLMGATTQNPSFELNAALLSRCRVVVLSPLTVGEIVEVVERALEDCERGLGASGVSLEPEGGRALAQLASGDARKALNLLELVVRDADAIGRTVVGPDEIAHLAQQKVLLYDKSGEEHFNLISALHKSLRESDPDAALYWLARMLAAGEDPLYIARRLVRFANEDVGLAAPQAIVQALAAWDAYQRLGSPEGDLALAQGTLFLALAPKSNSVYKAYRQAMRAVEDLPADPVPLAIRNAPTRLTKDLGYGEGYVYAHDTADGVGGIECLPDSLRGTRFYEPSDEGFESRLRERLERFQRLREKARDQKNR